MGSTLQETDAELCAACDNAAAAVKANEPVRAGSHFAEASAFAALASAQAAALNLDKEVAMYAEIAAKMAATSAMFVPFLPKPEPPPPDLGIDDEPPQPFKSTRGR